MRVYRKLGFEKEEARETVERLNELLANYQMHFHKLQAFHWNIKGRDFFELHDQFERMYRRAFENIDDIAERIRVFNFTPYSTLREYMDNAEIGEVRKPVNGEQMVRFILDDCETLLSHMIDVVNVATANGDIGTFDLMNGFIKHLEKDHWMLTSWLSSVEKPSLVTAQ